MTEHIMDRANKKALSDAVTMASLTLQSQRLWYRNNPSDPDKERDLATIGEMQEVAIRNYAHIILDMRDESA
jgi:hypothetical protein